MVKREFIEKKKAENITWQEPYYHDPINVCSEIRDKIRELPTITEQDIVKSYLDKLRKELQTEAMEHSGTGEEVIQAYVDGLHEAIKRIDNLLSEQGDTDNGNDD